MSAGWNYRVVKQTYVYPDGSKEEEFGVHECHYEPFGHTENAVPVIAESVETLRWKLQRMLEALDEGIITAANERIAFPSLSLGNEKRSDG